MALKYMPLWSELQEFENTMDSHLTCSVRPWQLCLKLPVLCYASNSWKCNYYASRGSSIMLKLCNGMLPLTKGLGQATCCKLADYGCMQL